MMIEPPRQSLVGTIFKIDDRIFVTVKLFAIEGVSSTMHRRRVGDLGVGVHFRTVELAKDGR